MIHCLGLNMCKCLWRHIELPTTRYSALSTDYSIQFTLHDGNVACWHNE